MATQVQIRLPLEETFLRIAFEWSHRSTCSSRIAVGAVVVNDLKQIIASGYNGAPRGIEHCNDVGCLMDDGGHCIRAIHAETNAIIQCAQNGVSTIATKVYVTHSPCFHCARHLIQAGVEEIIYAWEYKDLIKVTNLLNQAGIVIRRFTLSK